MTSTPHHVVIAGGGVAGLEALLALHALGGERVELTLVSPAPDFVYRPLAVAEPFALGSARRTPLEEATARPARPSYTRRSRASTPPARPCASATAQNLAYDALVLATGAASEPAFGEANVFTWDDSRDVDAVGGLLRDLEEGYSPSLAIVIPPGPGWPLPAYELALLIAGDARGMGMNPEITLVTPERAPLAIFGPRAVEVVTEELEKAGVKVELDAYAEIDPGPPRAHRHAPLGPAPRGQPHPRPAAPARPRPRRHPGRRRRLRRGRRPRPRDRRRRRLGRGRRHRLPGQVRRPRGRAGRRRRCRHRRRGRRGRRAQALPAGPTRPAADRQRPALHALRRRRAAAARARPRPHTLWWPPSKVNGRYLAPWLAARDEEAVADHLPQSGGLPVQTDLHRDYIAS